MIRRQNFQVSSTVYVQQLTTLHLKLRPRSAVLLAAGFMALLLPATVHAASTPVSQKSSSKGVIQTVQGVIPKNTNKNIQNLTVKASEVVPGTTATPLLSVISDGRSGLDTGQLEIRKTGSQTNVADIARSDMPGDNNSFTLFRATLGQQYRLTMNNQKGTHGTYTHSVRLAGDVDGNGKVDTLDLAAIKRNLGKQSAIIPLEGDVDRSGQVNSGDTAIAMQNLGAYLGQAPTNPLDSILPEGSLTLSGVKQGVLNDAAAQLDFSLSTGTFATDPSVTTVKVNNTLIDASKVTVANNKITVKDALQSGKNTIVFASSDSLGRNLYHTTTVWAGKGTLAVQLKNADGTTFTQSAAVELRLADDQTVKQNASTNTGAASFTNLPDRTYVVDAVAANNIVGTGGGVLSDGTVVIKMTGLNTPSSIDNNDFSQGLAGWDIGSAKASIISHVVSPGPTGLTTLKSIAPTAPKSDSERQAAAKSLVQPKAAPFATKAVDSDLMLGTAGEGQQDISRTFKTDVGTSAVKLRYRFVTSEVPGGYFGTKYNDYFKVALRTEKGQRNESNSMNGLGLAAFDSGGSTAWRNVTIPTNPKGDTFQADLAVANVADGLYDSQVIVDSIEEVKVRVTPTIQWDSAAGGLSVSYQVSGGELTEARDLTVSFASGTDYTNRLGSPVFTRNIPANTAEGTYGPFPIAGNTLAGDPAGTTHIVAATNEIDFTAIADVHMNYGANANAAVVSAGMLDALKDGLRAAGQSQATITSTARGPADQARAMFNNLVNPAHTVAQNIASQHALYAAAGDAVINTFAQHTAGLTLAQINANSATIQQHMVTEINNQGCSAVTAHCADPAVKSVVDVGMGAFSGNGATFRAAVQARVTKTLDEPYNNCYHFELNN